VEHAGRSSPQKRLDKRFGCRRSTAIQLPHGS
jgi:hypothetical protein